MGIIAAKCTQCGANIEVDDKKKNNKCQYCGANYIRKEADGAPDNFFSGMLFQKKQRQEADRSLFGFISAMELQKKQQQEAKDAESKEQSEENRKLREERDAAAVKKKVEVSKERKRIFKQTLKIVSPVLIAVVFAIVLIAICIGGEHERDADLIFFMVFVEVLILFVIAVVVPLRISQSYTKDRLFKPLKIISPVLAAFIIAGSLVDFFRTGNASIMFTVIIISAFALFLILLLADIYSKKGIFKVLVIVGSVLAAGAVIANVFIVRRSLYNEESILSLDALGQMALILTFIISVPNLIFIIYERYNLFFAKYNGGYALVNGKRCAKEDVVIPSEYKGKPVIKICEYAFLNNKKIKTLVIPASVKEIGDLTFYKCTNLRQVTVEDGSNPALGSYVFTSSMIWERDELPLGLKNRA